MAAPPAMKLHGMALSQNVLRVATVLNEKGIDFEIVQVSLLTGAHKHPDFLALNVPSYFALHRLCPFPLLIIRLILVTIDLYILLI